MKEEYKSLLEHQSVVEEKIDQVEQKLELITEVLEKVVKQVRDISEALINLSKNRS
tara:strand:+ start:1256 stop:1423 length:168 start_codon:yes stop_codon:yes gene_type:complete